MKKIELTQGQVTIVSDADYGELSKYKWCAKWDTHTRSFYAIRSPKRDKTGKRTMIYLSREVLGLKKGNKLQADHINRRTLDNRRCNLRICTHQENARNRHKRRTHAGGKCSSQYKGVHWNKQTAKWVSMIGFGDKRIYLGLFTSELEAAIAYNTKASELFGEFANLNKI